MEIKQSPNVKHHLPFIDSYKGLLISLIVLGHNTVFSSNYPQFFNKLYCFHVACFLLLIFIYPQLSNRAALLNRTFRCIVPHYIFFFIACVIYFFQYILPNHNNIINWITSVLVAIAISSEETCKAASGFRFFWFFPALLSVLYIKYFLTSLGASIQRFIIIILFIILHCFIGAIPKNCLPYFPWSLPLAFFLFPLGIIVEKLWSRYNAYRIFYLFCFFCFIVSVYISIKLKSSMGIAGDLRVYSISTPFLLLLHDMLLISAFFGLIGVSKILPNAFFNEIGRRSLFIFLFHPFIWQVLLRISFVEYVSSRCTLPSAVVLITFTATMSIAFAISLLLQNFQVLIRIIFPKTIDDWRFIFKAE